MRSEQVFQALAQVPNPFYLCQLTSRTSHGFLRASMVSSAQAVSEAFEIVARKQPQPESTVEAAVLADLAA
jgi:hypothetical protein